MTARKPLRLWPGVVLATLVLLLRFVVPIAAPDQLYRGLMSSLACAPAIALWWLFFSRAAWSERVGALILMAAGMFVTKRIVDVSIATGGMGMLLYLLAIPPLCAAFVAWAVATSRLSDGVRRATMVATILIATLGWALIRTGGFTMSLHNDLHWRWSKTAEERLMAQPGIEPPAPPTAPVPAAVQAVAAKASVEPAAIPAATVPPPPAVVEKPAEWPGFRGPRRNDIVPDVRIQTDWKASPPVQMWRRPVGPGWSSFAVSGDLIYTQEQRGPAEVVACYKLSTGKPVWVHKDATRFWESNGGPGPRATPTLSNGRVYTFGATGIVNVLDARSGSVVWSHNAAVETKTKTPDWGFASSPLVVGDMVIVAVAGQLVAYDLATGAQRWTGPRHGTSYSSPQLATIDGVQQILQLSTFGLTSVALADGKLLWEHAWKGYPIVQPALMPEGDVLISVTDSSGIRRLGIANGSGGWTAEERWTSRGLKPYFNDFVIREGHAFGFDGSILSCIDLKDGARKWKGGRYGNGQLLLLADQNVLLVQSEEGELALVAATPDQFTELVRFQVLEGKTWNHPVLVGDVLLVRNGEQMAAFRLSRAGS